MLDETGVGTRLILLLATLAFYLFYLVPISSAPQLSIIGIGKSFLKLGSAEKEKRGK